MIHYDIDTTEKEYQHLEGDVSSLDELKQILFRNDTVPDLVGYLSADELPDVDISIAAEKNLGFYICISDDENIYISLDSRDHLSETVDVWGDELCISKGLFIPVSLAWKGLESYIATQKLPEEINWMTADEFPEDGNYIC